MCAGATRQQVGYWQDSEHLFAPALQVAPANYIALDNYARALLKQGKHEEAVREFEEAVRLRPDHPAALNGLAISCRKLGRPCRGE